MWSFAGFTIGLGLINRAVNPSCTSAFAYRVNTKKMKGDIAMMSVRDIPAAVLAALLSLYPLTHASA